MSHLPSDWVSSTYLVINDVIPNGQRLLRHQITGDPDPPVCVTCGSPDDTNHRVKYCLGSRVIWNFIKNTLIQRLGLQIDDPAELISENLTRNGKAGLWWTLAAISFNIQNFRTAQLEDFKQNVLEMRWRKRKLLEKYHDLIFMF